MKLQNLAVIFAIIIIPITLTLSAYIGIQIDTASLQQSYKTKLMDATHDAVVAFELNTQNNIYSENADSLRRDIDASVNAFFTSLATSLGMPGANAEKIMPYVPALVMTLYDGYYIYSPSEVTYNTKETNEQGEQVNTTKTGYSHILKPYIYYSAKYIDPNNNNYIVVNYSLDSYISVYGRIGDQIINKSGYLYSRFFDNIDEGEALKENVKYIENGQMKTKEDCQFVYYNAQKIYNIDGAWYAMNNFEKVPMNINLDSDSNGNIIDTSAKKYKEDSLAFTNWLKDTNEDGMENSTNDISSIVIPQNAKYLKYTGTDSQGQPIYQESEYEEFNDDNTKILTTDSEAADSAFNQHKRTIMQISIQDNLNNAIALYNKNSKALGTDIYFSMPKMTEQDWDKILTNVNFVSFMQGLPVGIKKFNDYSIVTSTNNKQYIGTDSLYFVQGDTYHTIFCDDLAEENNFIGYKSNDFEKIKYTVTDASQTKQTRYYYARKEYQCYKCVVNYWPGETDIEKLTSSTKKRKFYTALARERYNLDKATKIFMTNPEDLLEDLNI